MGFKAHFGQQLRRLREADKLTRKELGALVGYQWETIRSVENGMRTPSAKLAVALDKVFGTRDMFTEMQKEAEQETTPFGELKENEQRATSIRIWDMRVVPGLLQNEEYARAILGSPEKVKRRIERQGVFAREDPPRVWVIICESVLRQQIGGTAVLRRQLEHLIRPDAPWTLQVMPQSVGWHIGLEGPITLLEFADDSPVAFVDGAVGGTVVDDESRVAEQWERWEQLTAEALSPTLSRSMIAGIIAELPEDS